MSERIKYAVILAAGMGTRLREFTAEIPKGFLRFGEDTIIEESIEKLLSLHVDKILIVTGYLSHYYDSLAKRYPEVQTVKNDLFAESGSLYSLIHVRRFLRDDFLLLDSDIIYEVKALEALLAHPERDVLLTANAPDMGEQFYARVNGDSMLETMEKSVDAGTDRRGAFVGIAKLSLESIWEMILLTRVSLKQTLNLEYEIEGFNALAGKKKLSCLHLDPLLWYEIDNYQQYEAAKAKHHAIYQNDLGKGHFDKAARRLIGI